MARTPAVLVVDQDPEARFHVKRLLGQVPFEFMGDVGLGVEAVVRAAEARPDLLLCGLREPVARALQTIESLVHALPQTPLIVYAESADLVLVRRAMQAGARDFLRAPFTPDELSRALAEALEGEERRRLRETGAAVSGPHGRLITVFGAKGGVGKTSLATNLAVALTRRAGQATVLVDLDDTFGDAAAALSVTAERTVTEAIRLLQDEHSDRKRALARHPSGLAVLAAPASPLEWRGITGDQVRALLRELTREFDAVVVDTASSLGDVSIAALQEAGRVLWVSTPEYASVRDSLQAFQAVCSLGAPQDRIGVVLNHTSPEIEVSASSIEEALASPIFWTVPYDRRLRHAAQFGEALVDTDPGSPAGGQHRRSCACADRRRPRAGQAPSPPARPGARRRLGTAASGAVARKGGAAVIEAGIWTHNGGSEAARFAPEPAVDAGRVELVHRIHQRLIQEFDLAALEQSPAATVRQAVEGSVRALVTQMAAALYGDEKEALVRAVLDEAAGLGPIQSLIEDQTVSEVMINAPDEVYFERDGVIHLAPVRFRDEAHILRVVERIITPLGRRVDESSPYVDARLPDGSRVNAVIPPLVPRSPTVTIRKFRPDRLTVEDLVGNGTMTRHLAEFLGACIALRLNVVVSGGAGTGKTTLLNALSGFIPDRERILTIEDPIELKLQQRHVISMEARPANIEGRNQVTQRDLLRNALRMRPDRIIVGEVRGEEAFDMMQAMNTGHEGSMTTVHANSGRDALARIENMVLMAGLSLPVRAIREQMASALHVLVHLARFRDGRRMVVSVSEVNGLEGDVVTMQELFRFDQAGFDEDGNVLGSVVPTGLVPTFAERFAQAGVNFDWGARVVAGSWAR